MNSKHHFFNLTSSLLHAVLLISIFSLLCVTVSAKENYYQFNKIAHLNAIQGEPSQWLPLVSHPNNSEQFFIANKAGQLSLVDDMDELHLLLDLNKNNASKHSSIKLTAFELHPNFSLRNELGYGTFYTAHLESIDKKSRTKRIQDIGEEIILKFDAVITEWQFSSTNNQKVDLNTKREVLRIAVPENSITIKQMSFSPFIKSWNDGFGLLYVALNGQEKWQKPLYSGVILRINPAKFGLRSFTVPISNPFIKEKDIRDEIYLLGGQDIKQFVWPSKDSDDILLSHRYKDKSLLSLTNIKNDWRIDAPKNIIYQGDKIVESALLYRGTHLPNLRNQLLLLIKENQDRSIESLSIKPSVNMNTAEENKLQKEWQFTDEQLASNSEVSFSSSRNGEILILDKTAGLILQISQENSARKAPVQQNVTPAQTQPNSNNKLLIIILIVALGAIFYFFKRSSLSAKAIVRKQFAHIELSESQQQIGFYHRHQKSIDTIIDIMNISACEVRLNDKVINVIDRNVGHGFDQEKEQDLRAIFATEKVDKMINGKIRQISLSFIDNHNKSYIVCLYMRKGSNRVTKKSFSVVIDDLIDWCWLIATKINSDETAKRMKKPSISSEPETNSAEPSQNEDLLANQASENHASAYKILKTEPVAEKELISEEPIPMDVEEGRNTVEQSGAIDTELVNALEKLVDLKQQGFLTQEEFTKAKENLLRSLFDK